MKREIYSKMWQRSRWEDVMFFLFFVLFFARTLLALDVSTTAFVVDANGANASQIRAFSTKDPSNPTLLQPITFYSNGDQYMNCTVSPDGNTLFIFGSEHVSSIPLNVPDESFPLQPTPLFPAHSNYGAVSPDGETIYFMCSNIVTGHPFATFTCSVPAKGPYPERIEDLNILTPEWINNGQGVAVHPDGKTVYTLSLGGWHYPLVFHRGGSSRSC